MTEEYESRIAELEIDRRGLIDDINKISLELSVSQQLNEKLMGELRGIVFNERFRHHCITKGFDESKKLAESDWQSYCKEKGLQSPEK